MVVDKWLTQDELTLHLIATGVLKAVGLFEKGKTFSVPYPPHLQLGLDRLVLACIRRNAKPPQGIPDLIHWCQQPIETWTLDLSGHKDILTESLLDGLLPTEVCESLACASADVEAELTEQELLRGALSICQNANAPQSYVALRRLFIEKPVLTSFELQKRLAEPIFECVSSHLRNAYEAAPVACITNDKSYCCCGECGNLLLRTVLGGLICEEQRCRRKQANGTCFVGRNIPDREEPMWLKRGLRRFVAAPGRAELRLEMKLKQLRLAVELWPAFDRYDLRVTFSDGEVWAVDVKDWADPGLLARRIRADGETPIPMTPSWTRAYFVFPNERKIERPDYVRAFQNQFPKMPKHLYAAFEGKFLADVRRKLKGINANA
jgi:hypothetical protein